MTLCSLPFILTPEIIVLIPLEEVTGAAEVEQIQSKPLIDNFNSNSCSSLTDKNVATSRSLMGNKEAPNGCRKAELP